MSKVLVAYATKTGCTEGIAQKVGEALSKAGATVDVVPVKRRPDPAAYDAVVVGSGVRMGSWHSAAKSWLSSNADSLKSRPTAMFTACLTLASEPEKADEVRAYTDTLLAQTGIEPVGIGLFAGWFMPEEFGLLGRTVLKKMESQQGDFRDWDAIAEWGAQVAGPLGI